MLTTGKKFFSFQDQQAIAAKMQPQTMYSISYMKAVVHPTIIFFGTS
jgi:hypothetical protein